MILFLSHTIDATTPMYGGAKGFTQFPLSSIQQGDSANTSQWSFPNHLGTHIDFPYHFYEEGQTLDDFPAEFWIIDGQSIQVVEVQKPVKKRMITNKHISTHTLNPHAEFILLKTGVGTHRKEKEFWENNPGLSNELVTILLERCQRLQFLGVDSISVSSWKHRQIGRHVHKTLLNPRHPTLIIEDMDLSNVSENTKFTKVIISPLRVAQSNGTPCTIFAEVEDS
jgi:kynurenine formamidase